MKFCPHCGKEIRKDINYCPICGKSISDTPIAPPNNTNPHNRASKKTKPKNRWKTLKNIFATIGILFIIMIITLTVFAIFPETNPFHTTADNPSTTNITEDLNETEIQEQENAERTYIEDYENTNSSQDKAIENLFTSIDSDNNNQISSEELEDYLYREENIENPNVEPIFKKYDTNNNNVWEKDEYLRFLVAENIIS